MRYRFFDFKRNEALLTTTDLASRQKTLALDCIADTFQRDENGHFTTLITYFESLNWRQLSDADLTIALRRLIFSKVNEGLFRSYRAEDPNLARIIRNIKEAVKRNDSFSLHREREVQWIVVGSNKKTGYHVTPRSLRNS